MNGVRFNSRRGSSTDTAIRRNRSSLVLHILQQAFLGSFLLGFDGCLLSFNIPLQSICYRNSSVFNKFDILIIVLQEMDFHPAYFLAVIVLKHALLSTIRPPYRRCPPVVCNERSVDSTSVNCSSWSNILAHHQSSCSVKNV